MTARITRGAEAPAYSPPLHEGVDARRLQGHEAGETETFWVGESLYQAGGEAQTSSTAAETIYYVIDGELTLTLADGGQQILGPGDSVHMPKGTERSVLNHTDKSARLLVMIAHPNGAA